MPLSRARNYDLNAHLRNAWAYIHALEEKIARLEAELAEAKK